MNRCYRHCRYGANIISTVSLNGAAATDNIFSHTFIITCESVNA